MGIRTAILFGVLVGSFLLAAPARAQSEIDPAALRAHTGFLANDLLEGRGTATRGEALAALYLTTRLRELGLRPLAAGGSDYRIAVPLTAHRFDEARMRLVLRGASGERVLRPPDFYHAGGGPAAFRDFGGDLLFAGATPGALAALAGEPDLGGRVVILGPPWTGLGEVLAALEARGAAGVVEGVPNDFYDRLRVVRGPVRYALPAGVHDPEDQAGLPQIVVGPAGIAALGLADELGPGRTLGAARPLGLHVAVHLAATSEPRTGYDVAALLPGTDSARSGETVVLMAHYDHVGFGQAMEGDSIWNGFYDNAAGVAMLLEIARVLSGRPLPVPVLFLFPTGEEQGLLGSTWFVHREAYPLDAIRVVVNLDGGIPPPDEERWVVAADEGGGPANVAVRALERAGGRVERRPLISDSDHWAFHRAGVEALFLYPPDQVGEPAIHTAKDEWRPDFPFEGLARYAEAALRVVRAEAAGP